MTSIYCSSWDCKHLRHGFCQLSDINICGYECMDYEKNEDIALKKIEEKKLQKWNAAMQGGACETQ